MYVNVYMYVYVWKIYAKLMLASNERIVLELHILMHRPYMDDIYGPYVVRRPFDMASVVRWDLKYQYQLLSIFNGRPGIMYALSL